MTANGNEAVVREFLTCLGPDMDGVRAAIELFMTDDVVYDNPGLPQCQGQAGVIGLYEEFEKIAGFTRVDIEMLHVLASGNLVMTERIDSAISADGGLIGGESTPAMATFELRGGKISAWRDYYDPTSLLKHFADLG
jgi:limonene-1,2-epoxide hydrolase